MILAWASPFNLRRWGILNQTIKKSILLTIRVKSYVMFISQRRERASGVQ